MSTNTALPLSQQLLFWTLQSMGRLDELALLSASSAKSAGKGKVIHRAWSDLVAEGVRAFGLRLDPVQLEQLEASLRELDAGVSRLDDLGLPWEDRLPPVLRLLIPQVGARLGALAAMVDGGLWEEAATSGPQLADWICDPLSPRSMGRVVEGLLVYHHPDWSTWTVRYAELETRKIASRKVVDSWRGPRAVTPNLEKQIGPLADLMGEGRDIALLLLRIGRLLAQARKELEKWTTEVQAERVAKALSQHAQAARRVLNDRAFLACWAELLAGQLGSPSERQRFLQNRPAWAAVLQATRVDPERFADALAAEAAALRNNAEPVLVRAVIAEQAFVPNPILLSAVAELRGAPGMLLAPVRDPFVVLQGQWRIAQLLRVVAEGRPASILRNGQHEPRVPSEGLRQHAAELRRRTRLIVHCAEEPPISQAEWLHLWFSLAAEMGGVQQVEQMVEAWNAAQESAPVPPEIESWLSDQELADLPQLAPFRAQRLAEQGDIAEALEWLKRAKGPFTDEQRSAAAATTLALARRYLRRVMPLRPSLLDPTLEELAPEMLAQARTAVETWREVVGKLIELYCDLHEHTAEAEALPQLLPAVVAIDALDAALQGLEGIPLPFGTELSEGLQEALEDHPSHPAVWAALAVWQELVDEGDPALSRKRARHHGGERQMGELRAELVSYGLL